MVLSKRKRVKYRSKHRQNKRKPLNGERKKEILKKRKKDKG